MSQTNYYVVKRDGRQEPVHFDKITKRIEKLLDPKMKKKIDVIDIVKKTIASIYPGITTKELDDQSAYQCAMLSTKHPDYSLLAGRISVSSLHKETKDTFVEKMEYIQEKTNIFNLEWLEFLNHNRKKINKSVDYERDLKFDYFGVKTMETIYLLKVDKKIVERPQDVFMRVASTINVGNLERTIESYNLMSNFYFTHASPTLFNSGNKSGNLVSCFLLGTEDSISGIAKTWNDVSHISKWGGGIGVHVSNIRAKGSKIHGTNGHSDGIIPMLQVYNSICRYVNQCFTPDTPIFTDRGFINIGDIQENMKVMTSDGTFRNVNQVFKREVDEDILHINTRNNTTIKCTKVHEILCKRNNIIEYLPAEELDVGDELIFPEEFQHNDNLDYDNKNKVYLNTIMNISQRRYQGLVYDLNIEENHNYLTCSGIVHNSGKRKGSFAMYLEPHHDDIFEFLDLRKNTGAESERARDLFLALWIPDLFMKQVESDGDWYLFCPNEAPRLNDVYGEEYEKLFWHYVNEGKYRRKLKARKVWEAIETSQFETGSPYILYKDNINHKSNQKNIGIIRSSNLCSEIVEYSDSNETACCNLASISLSSFLKPKEFNPEDKFVVYTKKDCPYCSWVKHLLKHREITFEEIEVELGDDNYKKLQTDPLSKITFPRVFQNEKLIGGMEDTWKYFGMDFDYQKLWEVTYHATINLDKVIDLNRYPTPEGKKSNLRHRPVGLGVQGLADTLAKLRIPYASEKALEINENLFGVIYHASLTASNDIAKEREEMMKELQNFFKEHPKLKPTSEYYDSSFTCNPKKMEKIYHQLKPNSFELDLEEFQGAYSTFKGSPYSHGLLQFHLWEREPIKTEKLIGKSWVDLIEKIKRYGTRNSLLTALMPTASTSQLLSNYESFEPFTSNMYTRRTLAGEFVVVNKHMIEDLTEIKEWNEEMKQMVIILNGSIQDLSLPRIIKDTYLNAYEMKQKWILEGCKSRGAYIDQTQSMNLYFEKPDSQKLFSSQIWAWKNGLKTGLYYLRSKPAVNAQKFTIDPLLLNKKKTKEEDEGCLMCSA
jgi:ribonucleotide reductase alpha subunit